MHWHAPGPIWGQRKYVTVANPACMLRSHYTTDFSLTKGLSAPLNIKLYEWDAPGPIWVKGKRQSSTLPACFTDSHYTTDFGLNERGNVSSFKRKAKWMRKRRYKLSAEATGRDNKLSVLSTELDDPIPRSAGTRRIQLDIVCSCVRRFWVLRNSRHSWPHARYYKYSPPLPTSHKKCCTNTVQP